MNPKIQKCIYCPVETDLLATPSGFSKPVPACLSCQRKEGFFGNYVRESEKPINIVPNLVPAHYDKGVQPWDLERVMETSGDCFVDARRTDVSEYSFRNKGCMLEDLKKARHCLDAAIAHMEKLGMK